MPEDEGFDVNARARQYGEYYKIAQRKGESDGSYRLRVAAELRQQGKIVEAHEAMSGRSYDDPAQGDLGPMAGIAGAMVQALRGRELSPHDPERQLGDDCATGFLALNPSGTDSALEAIFKSVGPGTGMDLIDAMHKDKK